jgi:hypothetical protein
MSNCTCGHPESDHFYDRCDICLNQLGAWTNGCECPEGTVSYISDGCELCPGGNFSERYCERFTKPKPSPAPETDPNQIALFGGAR